jgi:hypothetical protein
MAPVVRVAEHAFDQDLHQGGCRMSALFGPTLISNRSAPSLEKSRVILLDRILLLIDILLILDIPESVFNKVHSDIIFFLY